MIFFGITSRDQIIQVINNNPTDTEVEIMQFHNPYLAADLFQLLPLQVTQFVFYDVVYDALGQFINAIGLRLSNSLPNQPAITIVLGETESEDIEGIKDLLQRYGLNLKLIDIVSHNSKVTNNGIPKLSLPKESEPQQYQKDVEAQQFQRIEHFTPTKSDANKTVYESPESPRSPETTNGNDIELQDLSSFTDDSNNPPLSQPDITADDLGKIVANLTELNLALSSVGNILQNFQSKDHSAPSQPPPSDSSNHSFNEQELKREHDFVIRSRRVMSQQIPRPHGVNLAALAVENSVAGAPINQTGQSGKESLTPNGWVRAPTAPPIPKQTILPKN